MIRVTVWNEGRHERTSDEVRAVYPDGLHGALKTLLEKDPELRVTAVTLDDPEHGLPDKLLEETDVLFWWGHQAHQDVPWELADRVAAQVHRGMGAVFLHSAHLSRPFVRLMGTTCTLRWRHDTQEYLWVTDPSHPIARGVPERLELPNEEMYGEAFDIPRPDSVVFTGWFSTGHVFRSGCTFTRGHGRVFYFQPGHETNPVYHNEEIGRILRNAAHWVKGDKVAPYECIHDEAR